MPWRGTFRERGDDGAAKGIGVQRCFLVEYIIIRVYAAAESAHRWRVSTVFPVRVRVASVGARVCVNGVIDDFLTDPLSEITRSSRAPLGFRRQRERERETEKTEMDRAEA